MARPAKKNYGDGIKTLVEGKKYELRLRLPDGRERTKTFFGTRAEAVKARAKWAGELTGVLPEGSSMTVAELCRLYLANYSAKRHESQTQHTVSQLLTAGVIGQPIGKVKLNDLTLPMVEAWLSELETRGNKPSTINQKRKKLRAVITWAFERGLVAKNVVPAENLEDDTTCKLIFTHDEARRFLDRCEHPDELTGPMFAMILLTGARPGEVFGLGESSIDDIGHRAHIHKAIKRKGQPAVGLGPPKSKKAVRWIKLTDRAVHMLKLQREHHASWGSPYAEPWQRGLVFVRPDSGAVPPSSVARYWCRTLCERAGVPILNPYELRHTYISHMILAGERPRVLAELCGTSVAMIFKHYSHLMPDDAVGASVDIF